MSRSELIRRMRLWLPPGLFRRVTGRQRDVLFIWVPKCAGMSIHSLLSRYDPIPEDRWLKPLKKRFRNRGYATFSHVDVLQLVERGVVRRRYFENAFKFGFVRNPYDRLVSLFFYLKKIRLEEVPEALSFDEFCRMVARGEYPPVGLYNHKGISQCNPMTGWLIGPDGRLIVDFLGRFENLEEDLRTVCRTIGIPDEIPHENRTQHRHYREYYTPETRAIVEKVYRGDLDRFGYAF